MLEDTPIAGRKLSGNTASFTVTMHRGDASVKRTNTGPVSGSEIEFKREDGQRTHRQARRVDSFFTTSSSVIPKK